MWTVNRTSMTGFVLALGAALSVAPAAAQERGALDQAGSFPLAGVVFESTARVGELSIQSSADGLPERVPTRFAPAVGQDAGLPGSETVRGSDRGVEVVLLAIGGVLTVGSLTEYFVGERHWGMTGAEAGAFGSGVLLATWGGIRLRGGLD